MKYEYRTKRKRRSPYVIKTNLRRARVERGLIIQDVADATGYSFSTIVKAEQGLVNRRRPHDSRTELFWQTMSDFFKVPVEEIRK